METSLTHEKYTNKKGFCEDLDEGKMSLPLIYCLTAPGCKRSEIISILKHKSPGGLSIEMKQFVLQQMKNTKALETVKALLQKMQSELLEEFRRLEEQFGEKNSLLEVVLKRLWV